MKKLLNIVFSVLALSLLSSCFSDEPDSQYYYSFNGEMMSQYLQNRPQQFSMFTEVVERAGLMKQLSAYGHYTCFCPDNNAMKTYLAENGKTLETLTTEECDTLARTHLVPSIYSTYDLSEGVLPTQNMNRRPLEISFDLDADENSVVVVNGVATVPFASQNDSVENGIMQPIDKVLDASTRLLPDLIKANPDLSIFYQALTATGLAEVMRAYKDDDFESTAEIYDYITGSSIKESAKCPDDRMFGFTAFVVKNEVLAKRGVTDLRSLYDYACTIYKENAGSEEYGFDHLDSPKNPLYQFMAYHVLDRNVQGHNFLTVRDDFGVVTSLMNPTDWYTTLLPHSMMKVEHVVDAKFAGNGADEGDHFLNRRTDDLFHERGVKVDKKNVATDTYKHSALNGWYFYVDDVLKYDETTTNIVMNCRMRMDFSTVFPEIMSNDMRMNGYRDVDDMDANNYNPYDHEFKNGTNYYFPNGYLDGANVGGNGYFIYRRPRQGYWSLHGDEMICQGNYDISFRLPPVPFESDFQIRLGYAAMSIRGIAQIYFDNVPQGIPLDMTRDLKHSSILGDDFKSYTTMDEEDRVEEKKVLKNKGFYRGTNGGYRTDGTTPQRFSDIAATLRIVLCTVHLTPGEDHYLRVRAVSSKQGNNNEVMLDYLELVPKSVYGVTDEGQPEDDL